MGLFSVQPAFPVELHQHFLCVIFPPDAAVPLSVRVEREPWCESGRRRRGRMGNDRQGRGKRRDRGKKAKGVKKEMGGEKDTHTHTHTRSAMQARRRARRG